jgi:hypothetical protein
MYVVFELCCLVIPDLETYSCLADAQARCHKRFSDNNCDDNVVKRRSSASVGGDFSFRRLFQRICEIAKLAARSSIGWIGF